MATKTSANDACNSFAERISKQDLYTCRSSSCPGDSSFLPDPQGRGDSIGQTATLYCTNSTRSPPAADYSAEIRIVAICNYPVLNTGDTGFYSNGGLCKCPLGQIHLSGRPNYDNGCVPGTPNLTTEIRLQGLSEIQPLSTGKVTSTTMTATVTSGGQPKPGVTVKLFNTVEFTSGGHEANHISARPLGTINSSTQTVSLISDASGTVKFKFVAPAPAGKHTIKAECDSCASPANHKIDVKVPGLVALTADTATPRQYTLVGNTTSPGLNHPSSHWFAPTSLKVLEKVIGIMNTTGWGAVGVNDGSLPWGGLFDIKGLWVPSHQGHRDGTEVDISFASPKSPTAALKKKTFDKLCEKENTTLDIQTLWHKDDGYPEHYHIYLDGTGLGSNAGGGNCCTSYRITRVKKNKDGTPALDRSGNPIIEKVLLCEEVVPR